MPRCFHIIACYLCLFALLLAGGCTINHTINAGSTPVTKQDLQAATQIIGSSISAANSGAVLSISDALTILSRHSFNVSRTFRAGPFPRPTKKENYNNDYNPQTGIHTVYFTRIIQNPFLSKSVTDTLKYIYRDRKGNFIAFPLKQQTNIASVNYSSRRDGTISSLHQEGSFIRQDTLLITGFTGNQSELTVKGTYYSSGSVALGNSAGPRSYNLKLTYLNISVNRTVLHNTQQLYQNMKGAMSWQLKLGTGSQTGSPSGQALKGTIQLVDDGTALLRLQQSTAVYQINLKSGEVKNIDKEFAGQVASINPADKHLELLNGLNIDFSGKTVVAELGYESLQTIREAVNNHVPVWAEGRGTRQNNQFSAARIIFKPAGETGARQGIQFKEKVTSVNLNARTFTLANRVPVFVRDSSVINNQGDYISLGKLAAGLKEKETIVALGQTTADSSGAQSRIRAKNVIFFKNDNQ